MAGVEDEGPKYHLVFQFLTDDLKYARGFEMGMIYEKLRDFRIGLGASISLEGLIHSDNDEQLNVMCGRLGFNCRIKPEVDGWSAYKIWRASPGSTR